MYSRNRLILLKSDCHATYYLIQSHIQQTKFIADKLHFRQRTWRHSTLPYSNTNNLIRNLMRSKEMRSRRNIEWMSQWLQHSRSLSSLWKFQCHYKKCRRPRVLSTIVKRRAHMTRDQRAPKMLNWHCMINLTHHKLQVHLGTRSAVTTVCQPRNSTFKCHC